MRKSKVHKNRKGKSNRRNSYKNKRSKVKSRVKNSKNNKKTYKKSNKRNKRKRKMRGGANAGHSRDDNPILGNPTEVAHGEKEGRDLVVRRWIDLKTDTEKKRIEPFNRACLFRDTLKENQILQQNVEELRGYLSRHYSDVEKLERDIIKLEQDIPKIKSMTGDELIN